MYQLLQRLCTRRNLAILLTVIFFISMIPVLALSFYSYPAVDDFSYGDFAYHTLQAGGNFFDVLKSALDKTVETFYTWQGTYASVFLFALSPTVFGTQYYFVTAWIMLHYWLSASCGYSPLSSGTVSERAKRMRGCSVLC